MTQALKGKLALVTGASRGIGAAIAARLARDGASVIVHYASSQARADVVVEQIRDAGGEAEAVGANLSKPEGVRSLIDSLNGAFGGRFGRRLDILVNNAGRERGRIGTRMPHRPEQWSFATLSRE